MKNKQVTKNLTSITIISGLLLIAAALLLCGGNFLTAARAEYTADKVSTELLELIPTDTPPDSTPNGELEIPDHIINPDMPMPAQEIDGTEYIGVLEIKALGLTLPIIEELSYNNLRQAPCRYLGSAYTDDLVIAAHNYPAHFGHLQDLHSGDTISLRDTDGYEFTYRVEQIEVIPADAVAEIHNSDWTLTLFTCTIGGQNRLCVRCVTAE